MTTALARRRRGLVASVLAAAALVVALVPGAAAVGSITFSDLAPPPGSSISNETAIPIGGVVASDAPITGIQLFVDQIPVNNLTVDTRSSTSRPFFASVSLGVGNHTARVRATNSASQSGEMTWSFIVTKAENPPPAGTPQPGAILPANQAPVTNTPLPTESLGAAPAPAPAAPAPATPAAPKPAAPAPAPAAPAAAPAIGAPAGAPPVGGSALPAGSPVGPSTNVSSPVTKASDRVAGKIISF